LFDLLSKFTTVKGRLDPFLDVYADAICDVISDVNRWLVLTGGEFLIDTKMFRIGLKDNNKPEQEST
jgi:hypothetical protein